ncbi:conserved hypothetical protein (SH3-like domain protein) [Desulforapulum autotrophicum HRM2]|uniref:SH3b domain-containing protein n=1 Tax=Desulforapulum autotrophicum (strain ATCC 43914 / DSM 3382 / VKM B-1955 / HRM2) TaxID=177437 RepID=C0QEB9_DESAH|nr:DUF6515 family protein [Desulforapulum autotrophicum]ACN13236.1 conserved hypothetical protein (SH3-like domain protein) [Desulforapulum autotrophicum HRM2]
MTAMKKYKKTIGILIVSGIICSGTPVFAGHPGGHFPGFWPGPLFELIIVGGHHLFFRDGAFYHRAPAGYVPVPPPEGAVIPMLPPGYGIRIVDDAKYYYFNGVCYVRVAGGYMVVAPHVLTAAGEKEDSQIVKCKGQVSVTVDMLNVRSGPGMKYEAAFLAYKGETLNIYQESKGWLYVELPSGKLGWVDKRFTQDLNRVPAG